MVAPLFRGDESPISSAEPETDCLHILLIQFVYITCPVLVKALAIADHYEKAVGLAVRLPKGIESRLQHSPIVGTTLRNEIGVQISQETTEYLVVGTHRALEKSGSGKDDQADALSLQVVEQAFHD